MKLVLGNCERIHFWEDVWIGDLSICSTFSRLYILFYLCSVSIKSMIAYSPLDWKWNFNFKRIWKLSPSRDFSCKFFFVKSIDDQVLLNFQPIHMIWKAKVPSSVQIFAWSLALGKLNMAPLLKGVILMCVLLLDVSCAREMVNVRIICFCIVTMLSSWRIDCFRQLKSLR